jgi:glycosyltransferase involved in cell wall biosynthesis
MTASPGGRARILVLATTVPAKVGDGTPEFVVSLARALSRDNEVTILAPSVPGAALREHSGGVEIVRFRYFPKRFEGIAAGAIMANLAAEPWRVAEVPPLMLAFLSASMREIRRARPDLIHAHWLLPAGLIALSLRKMYGIPYIVTAHAADVFRFRGAPFRALKRTVMAKAAVATPVSRETASILGIPPEQAERLVVPMGVEIDRIQGDVGERAPEFARFLFVGRLVEKKGVDVLLRALAELREARLVVVGDGPSRPMLEELAAELGLSTRVTFAGQQGRERVAEELRLAHALVIPSRVAADGDADGTPVVMSEGMAAGVPIIASSLGGLAEHITSGRNGLLVKANDPDALADGLRRVLEDRKEATTWSEAALTTMREQLDIRVTAQRYQHFIDAALARQADGASSGESLRFVATTNSVKGKRR